MTERFMIDDAGTLIDMQTRNTYDYVSDVCGLLNELTEEKEQLKHDATVLICSNQEYRKENEQLKEENKELKENNEFAKLLVNHRGEMVTFANALIQDLDDEKTQEMWENFKDEMYKEWKQKRGIE